MATDINGAKIQLYLDGDVEPATTESAEWKHRLESLPEKTIIVGGLIVSDCGIMNTPLHAESFEYYMRRGKKYYFRGVQNKVSVTLEDPSVLAGLKYHDQVSLTWEAADENIQKYIEEGFGQLAMKHMGRAVKGVLDEILKDKDSKS